MIRLLTDLLPCEPAAGLGLEEALFETARSGAGDSLRVWVNDRAVVIGRSQVARSEVDLDRAKALGIPLLRRLSGGGTIYHYPGNLNVSLFLADAGSLGSVDATFDKVGRILAHAVSTSGAPVVALGNSLLIGRTKVGGAAQARRGSSLLFHTTLLVRPDTIRMDGLLLALRLGYRPLGVPSHPHPTTTLAEAFRDEPSAESLARAIAEAMGGLLGRPVRAAPVTTAEEERAAILAEARYRSDLWNLSR